jgi:hypothetical protein
MKYISKNFMICADQSIDKMLRAWRVYRILLGICPASGNLENPEIDVR